MQPFKSKLTVFRQICKFIPGHLVSKLARKHGIDKQSRTFSPWSHVVAHLFAQFSHSISLNDVCDCLQNHEDTLKDVRGATLPKRNTFSHANKIRSSEMAKELFWEVFSDIKQKWQKIGYNHGLKGLAHKFRKIIYVVDSTTIQLFANSMNWAKHRRQKVATKMHLSLNLQTFLPDFVVFEPAKQSGSKKASEVCSKLKDGEIVVFDKAYYDFPPLFDLHKWGVCFVMRPKENMQF
ncbi:MAG: IS4 family transposase [Verrucomicrobiota bacterium]|nr:IS4 family transposase [Verrucomicrobiota bacterium]